MMPHMSPCGGLCGGQQPPHAPGMTLSLQIHHEDKTPGSEQSHGHQGFINLVSRGRSPPQAEARHLPAPSVALSSHDKRDASPWIGHQKGRKVPHKIDSTCAATADAHNGGRNGIEGSRPWPMELHRTPLASNNIKIIGIHRALTPRAPGDQRLVTPWTTASRRRAAAGPRRRGGGATRRADEEAVTSPENLERRVDKEA